MMRMVYPSLTDGLMISHQISATTANIENVINKAKNKFNLPKSDGMMHQTLRIPHQMNQREQGRFK